ncbi:MAG TPA: hypothetical protein VNF73_08935, partial [Candidatus Saccharimonadales bacterium]|nr:hypothetical protein [Candidatus Saccharimonadales bacterium]
IRAAIVRARAAGLAASVRFRPGDLAQPPPVGATSGYAIDSLMFLPSLAGALAAIGATLPPEAPLFATLLVAGRASEDRLRHSFDVVGVEVERLDDVTTALGQRSRRRAGMARALLREDTTVRGRMAMLLVLAEERLVGAAIARGRVRRWRFVIRYPVSPAC